MVRSLITLKCLSFTPTGGITAAPTTSLPEQLGGVRNWDYRFCWIRDATLTLYALLTSGYREEARLARWLAPPQPAGRAPGHLRLAGERRLTELELPWLPGYEDSRPVRIGNSAFAQLQIDVYGELVDAMHVGRKFEQETHDDAWRVQKALLAHLARIWAEPDEGIWEVRGPRRHFTHSKLMAWVAFDRAIKSVESRPIRPDRGMAGATRRSTRTSGRRVSTQRTASCTAPWGFDAALLLIPQVGFLPAEDPRVHGTVAAIERELMIDGLVLRYRTKENVDSLPPGEGAFLACSFWLADAYAHAAAAMTTPRGCSSICSRFATTSACSPRSTILAAGASSVTSRRALARRPDQHDEQPDLALARPAAGRARRDRDGCP